MRHALPVFCLLLTLTVLSASAGPRVRVVLATNNGEGIDGGLSDVTGSLGILKFTRFQLVESKSVAVGGVTSLAHGLTLKCSGTPTAYHVAVVSTRKQGHPRRYISLGQTPAHRRWYPPRRRKNHADSEHQLSTQRVPKSRNSKRTRALPDRFTHSVLVASLLACQVFASAKLISSIDDVGGRTGADPKAPSHRDQATAFWAAGQVICQEGSGASTLVRRYAKVKGRFYNAASLASLTSVAPVICDTLAQTIDAADQRLAAAIVLAQAMGNYLAHGR